MKKVEIIALLIIAVLAFSFSLSVKASDQELFGYVYSETVGWISLNCANTNSCNTISYKIFEDSTGRLSGYGYSQNGEWINFNPNFGGVNINSDSALSGWAYSEKGDWLNFVSAKNISAGDLQNEITSVKNMVNNDNLSDASTASLLNSLCRQFLNSDECNAFNNQ